MKKYIETERLILKPLAIKDASEVFEWVGDKEVNRFMRYTLYTDIAQVEKWISSLREADNEFGFFLKETGKLVGSGSLTYNETHKAYELGYNINRNFWNQGYATEAGKALLAWGKTELGASDFFAQHANDNIASGKVILKCGFIFSHYGEYSRFDQSETFQSSCYTLHMGK